MLFLESKENVKEEELEGHLDRINQALEREKVAVKIAAVFDVREWPKVPSRQIYGKELGVVASQLLEEMGTGEEIPKSETVVR